MAEFLLVSVTKEGTKSKVLFSTEKPNKLFADVWAAKIKALESRMTAKDWPDGVALLHQAIKKANNKPTFFRLLDDLFADYSTISARYDIFSHFGEYYNDLKHLNAVDSIDAAFNLLRRHSTITESSIFVPASV